MKRIIITLGLTLTLLTACTLDDALDIIDMVVDLVDQDELKQTELQSTLEHQNIDIHEMQVHFIDVGQADATLIRFYDDDGEFNILYDTGDWQGNEVVPYLKSLQIKDLDLVIISHPHADHIGQLSKVIDAFPIGEIWMTENEANTQLFMNTILAIEEADIPLLFPVAGHTIDYGPLHMTVLHPGTDLSGDLNRDSLSTHMTYGDVSIMFTGDADQKAEEEIMGHFKDIQANILHLGHHGSNTSSHDAFVKKVDPSLAIYSAGLDNKYGHPHDEVIDTIQALQIDLYGTIEDGTIVLTTDGNDIQIDTYPHHEKN